MKLFKLSILFILLSIVTVKAQNNDSKQQVDASNPTNFYTQVNTLFEYTTRADGTNLYGFRGNVIYTFNQDNLVLAEVPVLYNDATNKFGISDIRLRYFTVVKRVMTKEKFSVIAPFVDVTLPTGSFENGLGTSSLVASVGAIYGFAISKKVLMFPGLSAVHVTKPGTDLIPDDVKASSSGFGAQANMSIRFNDRWFLFVNPILTMLNTDGDWNEQWTGEFNLNHMIIPNKLKANIGYYPNFTAEIHTVRMGVTFFL
ncbi:hypothetical protein [Jejuia pallidilutea]|uniref:Outer membrane protein beta-barrel domain-containing protein n=1 Tax=Jejuia pallidilutea TaxID=504487 RepID=A0A090WGZ9_9FLAO|nr:hypothetical protein [Jejuia pallidilutea]GAL66787.1 hypothetical protein JCM19301_1331 [Jejuia pallidilutea]GAL70424.1 hypothetical protein JCM19302_3546 [Jejuia pallidilutea]GAL90496.1 hypothetical protein JCM19538_261 [Jejuia pallidilutea]